MDQLDQLRAALDGRYSIDRLIGQGGMASVYLASDTRHERQVAIKVLRPELAATMGADRFLREIKVAAQLQHPNILALYDSGAASGFLYYVMPYVQGESLRARMDREQQLSLQESIQLTCDIADALHYAHSRQVVHRDIKPENILLQDGRPLVADFGIARAVSQAGGEKLTETGMAVGTPHYMSPEQAVGGEHIDGRTDQYSLACMLYEMLVGQPPFVGPNAMAILARHSMEAVPSLQVVRSSVPDDIEDAILRALEKTPADRFPTLSDFADALAAVDIGPAARRTSSAAMRARRSAPHTARRATGPVAQVPQSLPARVAAWTAGHRRVFWATAAGLLLVVGGLITWKTRLRPAGASTTPDADPNRIAVMYFDSRGVGDSAAYLADGLTESLIHELSGVRPLQVISRGGVSPYRHAAVAPDSVGRALKVGTLVTGNVTQLGDRLRVTISLVNAQSGTEIGSTTVERPRQEIFALQDDVAKEVALFLRQRLGQEIRFREGQKGTRSAAAWELRQQAEKPSRDAEDLLASGDTTATARKLAEADTLLAQAERLDPKWVEPIVQRGWLAYREMDLKDDKAHYSKWLGIGMGHANRALTLQPADPDALELRGVLTYWRWLVNLEPDQSEAAKLLASAEQDLRAAVTANPTAAIAWTWLSHMLMAQSRSAEAKLAALRSYEADPYLSSAKQTLWRLFQSSLDLEDQVEATHWCQEGQRRFPEFYRFTECRIWLFALKGQTPNVPEAWELYNKFLELSPAGVRPYHRLYGQMLVAMALARAGLADSARAVAVRSRGDPTLDSTHDLALYETIVRTFLGDRDEAIRLLSTYIAANPQMRESMARDQSWWFRDLRDDPRYKALLTPG